MLPLPTVTNTADLPSPALLLIRERVEENLRRMIAIAGDPARLRPHVKTHKLAELVRRQIQLGIEKFKCATIAEAEMTAAAGAPDVLLAVQPVGPQARRFAELVRAFPRTRFGAVVDDPTAAMELARHASAGSISWDVLLDLDIGQHRTGIAPGPAAIDLAHRLTNLPGITFGGLHAYDGHLHDRDPEARRAAAEAAFAPVSALRAELQARGLQVPRLVVGGTPTFPFHARRADVECSPGTCVLWDAGYTAQLPDLDFVPAAFLLTRVVSRPTANRLCLDLGHKAVASEMPQPRVVFPSLPDAVPVAHNEEHLVLEIPTASNWKVGDTLLGIPWHVCPTVALHAEVWVIDDGAARLRWEVTARARRLTV